VGRWTARFACCGHPHRPPWAVVGPLPRDIPSLHWDARLPALPPHPLSRPCSQPGHPGALPCTEPCDPGFEPLPPLPPAMPALQRRPRPSWRGAPTGWATCAAWMRRWRSSLRGEEPPCGAPWPRTCTQHDVLAACTRACSACWAAGALQLAALAGLRRKPAGRS
jgi:hypothetical protein